MPATIAVDFGRPVSIGAQAAIPTTMTAVTYPAFRGSVEFRSDCHLGTPRFPTRISQPPWRGRRGSGELRRAGPAAFLPPWARQGPSGLRGAR